MRMRKVQVPFYSNTPDDTHCYQASLRMILKYFLPERNFTWKELDKFTAKKEGLYTWSTQSFINLLEMGFDVVDMDGFEVDRFIKEGGDYLIEKYGKEVGETQIKRSDIKQERRLYAKYQKFNTHQQKLPTLEDIKKLLNQGFLVICNVNAYALDNEKGYAGHFVVLFGYDEGHFYLHDPGLPGLQDRKITYKQFLKGWDYPDRNSRNLMGFKLKTN